MSEYKCCFDDSKSCSVRTLWKLKPENLVEFCKICNGKGSQFDLDQSKHIVDFFNILITGEKKEKTELRQMLFDLIKEQKGT